MERVLLGALPRVNRAELPLVALRLGCAVWRLGRVVSGRTAFRFGRAVFGRVVARFGRAEPGRVTARLGRAEPGRVTARFGRAELGRRVMVGLALEPVTGPRRITAR